MKRVAAVVCQPWKGGVLADRLGVSGSRCRRCGRVSRTGVGRPLPVGGATVEECGPACRGPVGCAAIGVLDLVSQEGEMYKRF